MKDDIMEKVPNRCKGCKYVQKLWYEFETEEEADIVCDKAMQDRQWEMPSFDEQCSGYKPID